MNAQDHLDAVLVEIQRFEERARAVTNDKDALEAMERGMLNHKTGAMHRASLDLSAALSAMRQHGRRT